MRLYPRGARPSRALAVLLVGVCCAPQVAAQAADSLPQSDSVLAQDGLYQRPFVTSAGGVSLGGYVEGNSNYFVEDGVTEGLSMELRRFNIFLFAPVSSRVRFLSELEFEHGTEEIALETALIDVRMTRGLVIRAGVLLPPLGAFNQNHDSPRWDFVERPLVSTGIIPATLAEIGAGVYGRLGAGSALVSYDVYLTNGLGDGVLDNARGRTDIPSGRGEERFAEDNNGSPALSFRGAMRHAMLGELGVSYYGAIYNSFRVEGVEVDERRHLDITAVDYARALRGVQIRAEVARAHVDVPADLAELFAETQWGGHIDVVVPVWSPEIPGYAHARVEVAGRFEYVDYNRGDFSSTGRPIFDDVTAATLSLAMRPTPGTVFRLNARRAWIRDFAGNPTAGRAGLQVGFATYF